MLLMVSSGIDNTVITCQTISNGYLEGHLPCGL
jgi:hypothetical protein